MPTQFSLQEYDAAAAYIRERISQQPAVGLILGSGLSPLAESIEQAVRIPYAHIPHFPVSTVEGHAGQLVTRSMLLESCWDASYDGLSNLVDVNLSRLRRKLEAAGDTPLLHTIRRAGVVFGDRSS